MEKKVIKRILAMSAAILMAVSLILPAFSYAKTNETDKGTFHIDWNKVELTNAGKNIPAYGVLKDANGYYIYAVSSVETDTFNFFVKYDESNYNAIIFKSGEDRLFDINNEEIERGKCAVKIKDNVRYTEFFVPFTFFESDDFVLATQDYGYILYEEVKGQDKAITFSENIKDATEYIAKSTYSPKKPANYDLTESANPNADYSSLSGAYSGIEIDGYFDDWSSVVKYRTYNNFWVEGNDACTICAIVWDGDVAYIYIQISGACVSNGSIEKIGISGSEKTKYFIEADTGEKLEFGVTRTGSNSWYGSNVSLRVNGVGGATIAGYEDYWLVGGCFTYEISVPLKKFAKNAKTLVLGISGKRYLTDVVGNIGETEDEPDSDESDIVIDGDMSDWSSLPYTFIYYCDKNRGNDDSCYTDNPYCYPIYYDYNHKGYSTGSVYLSGDKLCGYLHSRTDRSNYKIFREIKIKVNDSTVISVYASSTYDANYNVQGQCSGAFVLKDASGRTLGKLYSRDERRNSYYSPGVKYNIDEEFSIDLETLAASLGLGVNEIKSLEVNFPYVGYQWLKVAGTSTAPFVGIFICMAIVGATWAVRYFKNKKVSAI